MSYYDQLLPPYSHKFPYVGLMQVNHIARGVSMLTPLTPQPVGFRLMGLAGGVYGTSGEKVEVPDLSAEAPGATVPKAKGRVILPSFEGSREEFLPKFEAEQDALYGVGNWEYV